MAKGVVDRVPGLQVDMGRAREDDVRAGVCAEDLRVHDRRGVVIVERGDAGDARFQLDRAFGDPVDGPAQTAMQ